MSAPDREEFELPLRGKPLRDRIVLRIIAVDRALHFLVLGLLGWAALIFGTPIWLLGTGLIVGSKPRARQRVGAAATA